MGIHSVYVFHHFFGVGEFFVQKIHCVPQVVASPVSPILDNSIEGHTQFAVFLHYANNLFLAFVAFTLCQNPYVHNGNMGTCPVR